jgi:hypothetical protein
MPIFFNVMMSDCLYDSQEVSVYGLEKFAENPTRTVVPGFMTNEASGHCVRIIAPEVPCVLLMVPIFL